MAAMRMHAPFVIALVACAVTSGVRRSSLPGAQPLYSHTEPAPTGSALRVFVEPTQLVGWVAGSRSYAGQTAKLAFGGGTRKTMIADDNTFAFPIAVDAAVEATITAGDLTQKAA